jgi:peptide/nickel transport system substrate-binding protein
MKRKENLMSTRRRLLSILSVILIVSFLLTSCASQATPTAIATEAVQAPAETSAPAATQAPIEPTEAAAPVEPTAPQETAVISSEPKILKLRLTKDIGNLDPAFIVGSEDDMVDRAVMEGLIRYNAEGKPENQLVEWIKTSDDGLTIDFKLREGVMWQRGYGELTTDDVKFSYERFIDPNLDAAYKDDFASLDHVEIVDKYEAKIILKEPQATLWTTTLPLTSGLIVCKKFVEEVGLDKFKTDIVGTGPYVLAEWKPNEKLVLERNPDYWGVQPYYDEIQIIPIDDDKAAEVAMQAGEVDFGIISLASTDKFQSDPNFKVEITPSYSYSWIGMDVENPKLADINVREAIRYGIDVPSILAAAYDNKAPQATTLIPEGIIGHWADAPVYQRDVAKAKDYMVKAGLTTLDLNLAIQDTTEYRTWAEIAQQNLAEIGININIVPLDSSSFWDMGSGEKGKDVELFAIGYSSSGPDPAWFAMWFTCDQVGVWNWMRWCSPEFDQLHTEGIMTLDDAKRNQIYIDMQKLWDAAVISVWITNTPLAYASKPNIDFVIYPGGLCPMLRDFKASE